MPPFRQAPILSLSLPQITTGLGEGVHSIKGAIVSVLGQHKDGLSRTEIAGQIGDDVLATIGVKRDELAAKLRQPLGELVGDRKLHTVGEKRLMKYHAGAKK